MSNNVDLKAVVTGEVRLSYVNLFVPRQDDKGAMKYSTTILIPKSDFATKAKIDAAINAAKQEGLSKKWSGVVPPNLPIAINDGDGVRPKDGTPYGEECKGHWVITASTLTKPGVVDANCQPILDQTQIYSGIYGRADIQFYPYFSNGSKGIACGLRNIQKLRDGEPLGGGRSAESAFGGASFAQQNYQQPQQQYQPTTVQYDPITGQPI